MLSPLLKDITFWVATILFVVVAGILSWKIIPPVIEQYQGNKAKVSALETELVQVEQYASTLEGLEKNQAELNSLHQTATLLLPTEPTPEYAMLQFDSLVESLGLVGVTVEVPLVSAPSANLDVQADQEAVEGETNPSPAAPAAAPTEVTFTISGNMSFAKAREVLISLKSFGRWNKVTSVEMTNASDRTNVTIGGIVLYKAQARSDYSGEANLLDRAKEIFSKYQQYATVPDVATEGNYGRADPLAPVN